MTELEYMAAVDTVVARWLQDHQGEPLKGETFAQAERAKCHTNAESYVAEHGDQIVRGFLVQHPHEWDSVWVMPHSVVRTAAGLIDVTLNNAELHGVAFFAIGGDPEGFKDWANQYPQETRSIVQGR
jgi:hypothetical protein